MLGNAIKRFILWDYPRASWQYDVVVALILAFIFLTPRSWFRDQPRIPRVSEVATLGARHGDSVLHIETELLAGVPADQRVAKVNAILKSYGKTLVISRVEPILDSDQEVKGYMAFARP